MKIIENAHFTRFKACKLNFKSIAVGWQQESGTNLAEETLPIKGN